MLLTNEVELIEGEPIAYIKPIKSLVLADLHLGYEGIMAKQGVLLPQVNLKSMLLSIGRACSGRDVSTIIVDGDIKNAFTTVETAEFNELYDFANHVRGIGAKLVLIKGNHDNFVERYKGPLGLEVYRQETKIGDFDFFHGEELPSSKGFLVMGHEHPAIGVYDDTGRLERLKCFLFGSYKGSKLLVMPSASYFSSGTAVNIEPKSALLAPVFKQIDVDEMRAVAVGYGSTLDFGTVGGLRKLAIAR